MKRTEENFCFHVFFFFFNGFLLAISRVKQHFPTRERRAWRHHVRYFRSKWDKAEISGHNSRVSERFQGAIISSRMWENIAALSLHKKKRKNEGSSHEKGGTEREWFHRDFHLSIFIYKLFSPFTFPLFSLLDNRQFPIALHGCPPHSSRLKTAVCLAILWTDRHRISSRKEKTAARGYSMASIDGMLRISLNRVESTTCWFDIFDNLGYRRCAHTCEAASKVNVNEIKQGTGPERTGDASAPGLSFGRRKRGLLNSAV